MNKILLSIRPEHVVNILNGKKTIEIRKSIPKCELPCEVYIYCCKHKKFWHVGCMAFFSDDLWYHPVKKIYICDDSCELMCLPEGYTYTKDNFLNGKVVAKFILNEAEYCDDTSCLNDEEYDLEPTCLTAKEIQKYSKKIYVWHIDNLEIFDKPKELSEYGIKRAPQSYCYLKGE